MCLVFQESYCVSHKHGHDDVKESGSFRKGRKDIGLLGVPRMTSSPTFNFTDFLVPPLYVLLLYDFYCLGALFTDYFLDKSRSDKDGTTLLWGHNCLGH